MKFKNIAIAALVFGAVAGFAVDANANCTGGYSGTQTINSDNTTVTISSTVATSSYGAVVDCATGSTINITSAGSLVIGTGTQQIGLLVPTGAPGDATGILNNEGQINTKTGVELDQSFGTINNGSALGSNAKITGNSSSGYGIEINGTANLTQINNYGLISGSVGIYAPGSSISTNTVNTIDNYGSITGTSRGINIQRTAVTEINNQGTITGGSLGGIYVGSNNGVYGTVTTLDNTGSIIANSGGYGINIQTVDASNHGTITTLNNQQGAGNSNGALTYSGYLPTNYNIIIKGLSQYGQLSVTSASGSMAFGILAGSVVNANGRYTNVLQGFSTLGSVTSTTGTYNTYSYSLVADATLANAWDLCFGDCSVLPATGPTTADTQASLVNTASALQNIYILQNSVLANSFAYDCNVFGASDVCVSAGGRNTAVSTANGLNNTSALLIAGYRIAPQYRIGAYADQNLSVNNGGSTVNLGNNTPLLGLFAAWNEKQDGTGSELKASFAYGQKNTAINRQVVGTSEAGSGSSSLNSQGAQVIGKHGFAVADKIIVSPYVGIRYTQNNMGGYTEATSSSVTAPLTYSALNTNATTALAGVGASYKVIPTVTTFASAGVETDTNTSNGSINATGVSGLTPVNFNPNPVKTRPTATIGAYYDIEKNQRLGITGIYRQEAYQAVSTTTVMATYTVGL